MFGTAALPFFAPAAPWLLAGALLGYLVVMWTNPARASFRDGWRAVRRYRLLWVIFGTFGFAYAVFQLALRIYRYFVLPPGERPAFMWLRAAWGDPQYWLAGSAESLWYVPPHAVRDAVRDALLPAVESVAGLFHNLVTTFPLAALAAILLLVNWDGHQVVLLRALRQRCGRWGWALFLAILCGALAAIGKALLYLAPALVILDGAIAAFYFRWSPVVAWLGFLFEYLFGVCVQVYLILVAYCWVRGVSFTPARLLDFTIRRSVFALKWAAVVLMLSSLFIDLPLILKNFAPFQGLLAAEEASINFRIQLARSVLAGFLLIFSTMQITLTFHNESLLAAAREHGRFLRRHGWRFAWFLVVAAFHFLLFAALNLLVSRALGDGTAPGIVWSLLAPWLNGLVGAWLLASWVCLFRSCDARRRRQENWIKF